MASRGNSKYYLVCDLEATCVYPRQQDWEPEIIEIGAVLLDKQLKEISEFQEYVCPNVNGILTRYCLDLTKITQRDVDRADPFKDVYGRMVKWMKENGLNLQPGSQNFTFITDGIFDCNQYIRNQCKLSKIEFPKWAKNFGNIKKHFTSVLPHMRKSDGRSNSITEMMEKLRGLPKCEPASQRVIYRGMQFMRAMNVILAGRVPTVRVMRGTQKSSLKTLVQFIKQLQ